MPALDALIRALPALLFAGFFALVRWLAPPRVKGEYTVEELEAWHKQYRRIEIGGMFWFFLLLWPVCATAWTIAFILLGQWHDSLMPEHLLLVRMPHLWAALLPGMALGLISGSWLLELGHQWYFGAEVCRRMQVAWDHKARIDCNRAFHWLSICIAAVALGWVVLDLDWYTRLEEDRIVVNRLFGFGETAYRYDQVTKLVEATHLVAPNGKLVERTRQVVFFVDGESWDPDDLVRDAPGFKALLEAKTGKIFQKARFVEDVK